MNNEKREILTTVQQVISILTFLFFLSGGIYAMVNHIQNETVHFTGTQKEGLLNPKEKAMVQQIIDSDDAKLIRESYQMAALERKELKMRIESLEDRFAELKTDIKEIKALLTKKNP